MPFTFVLRSEHGINSHWRCCFCRGSIALAPIRIRTASLLPRAQRLGLRFSGSSRPSRARKLAFRSHHHIGVAWRRAVRYRVLIRSSGDHVHSLRNCFRGWLDSGVFLLRMAPSPEPPSWTEESRGGMAAQEPLPTPFRSPYEESGRHCEHF